VVITGLGCVTALADSVDKLFAALCGGQSGVSTIESFDTSQFPVHFGGEIKHFDVTKYIDRREAKRMDRYVQFAVVAARMAMEDADLNMRARLRGFRCLYVPEAIVHHMVNRSIGTFSHTYVYFGHRNSEYLFWKNMPTPLLWRYIPERSLFNLLSFLYFLPKGRGFSFLRAKVDFLRNCSDTLEKRRMIQMERTLSTKDLHALLDRNWLRYRRKAAVQS